MDRLEEWQIPSVFDRYFPSGLSGYDKDGAPVVILPFSGMDIWGMLHTVTKVLMKHYAFGGKNEINSFI